MMQVFTSFGLLFALLLGIAGSARAQGITVTAHAGPASQRTSACAPRVVRGPRAPVRIAYPARHVTSRGPVWIPGHYEEVTRRVWVPGCERTEWVPPRFEFRIDACGRRMPVLVLAGHWRRVVEPGHYETRLERVWVPGRWR